MVRTVGFIGIGGMGLPMASNLVRAGTRLVVWNRTPARVEPLASLGALVAGSAEEVFSRSDVVIMMLFDNAATDAVLGRGTARFTAMVADRTVVNMGTLAPDDSRSLAEDVHAAGGRYVEAPVSGSLVPAEAGRLVAMLAGDRELTESLRTLLQPMCHAQVYCGAIGDALSMKLAVNIFRMVMSNGLLEAVHFADRLGLDRTQLRTVLDASPMASEVSRLQLAKMLAGDHSPQAAIVDTLASTELIIAEAERADATCELIRVCRAQYQDTVRLGYGSEDLIAAIRSLES